MAGVVGESESARQAEGRRGEGCGEGGGEELTPSLTKMLTFTRSLASREAGTIIAADGAAAAKRGTSDGELGGCERAAAKRGTPSLRLAHRTRGRERAQGFGGLRPPFPREGGTGFWGG